MLTKLLFIILIVAVLALSALFYLNEFLLPVRIKDFAIQKISEELQRDVSIDSLQYFPWRGLVIKDIVVSEKKLHGEPLISIDEISLGILPFFPVSKKKLVVPTIVIKNPTFHLTKTRLGVWNIQDLLAPKKPTEDKPAWNLYAASVVATGGTIVFSDQTFSREPVAIIENISLRSSLSLPDKAQATVRIRPTAQNPCKALVNINYDLTSGAFRSQVNIENLSLAMFQSYLNQPSLHLESGIIKVASLEASRTDQKITAKGSAVFGNTRLKIEDDKTLFLIPSVSIDKLTWQDTFLEIKGMIESPQSTFQIKNTQEFKSGIAYDFLFSKKGSHIDSIGHIKLDHVSATFNPGLKANSHAQGQASFSQDQDKIFNAQAELALTETKVSIDKEKKFTDSPHLKIFYRFDPSLKKDPTSYSATATLSSASLQGIPLVSQVQELTGELSLGSDEVTSSGLKGVVDQAAFEVSGSLKNFQKPSINISGKFLNLNLQKSQQMLLSLQPDSQITMQGLADIEFQYEGGIASWAEAFYSVTATLSSVSLQGLPLVGQVQELSGHAWLGPNQISSSGLKGVIDQSTFEVSGSLKNFQKPSINISGKLLNLNLQKSQQMLLSLQPDSQIKMQGLADIKFQYEGGLKSLVGSSVRVSAELKEAAFSSEHVPEGVTDISGKIKYAARKISRRHLLPDESGWENLEFIFRNKKYTSQGSLKLNNLSLRVLSENFDFTARGNLSTDRINIFALTGKYLDSSLNLKGSLFYPQENRNIRLDISGDGRILLDGLPEILPGLSHNKTWKAWNPQGLFVFNGSFSGEPDNWRSWAPSGRITSPEISLKGYRLNNVDLRLDLRDRMLIAGDLRARLYNGPLQLKAQLDLNHENIPYHAEVKLTNTDIYALRQDSPLKDKPFSGLLSFSYEGKGALKDLRQAAGQGTMIIQEGQLMHIDLFKGLGQLLFIPEYQNITFENADSNFVIKDEKIFVQDGVLRSNQMRLMCNGTVDFNGNLDLDLISRFDRSAVLRSKSLQRTIAAAITQADDFVTIKLTGTIQKPNYYIVPQPFRLLEKTRDFIFDGLPSIFEDLF